jgi:hypothetical protein
MTHFGFGGKLLRAAQNHLARRLWPAHHQLDSPNRKHIHIIKICQHRVEFAPAEIMLCFTLMTEAKPKTPFCSCIMRSTQEMVPIRARPRHSSSG